MGFRAYIFLTNIGIKNNTFNNRKKVIFIITTTKDSNLRLACQRRGFLLMKRRDKKYAPGLGSGYMILDAYSGAIVKGHRYELTPEDVRDFLNEN